MARGNRCRPFVCWGAGSLLLLGACQSQPLSSKPLIGSGGLLGPSGLLAPSPKEYGHLGQYTVTVPATTDIFLAGAPADTVLEYPPDGTRDSAPAQSPVQVLKEVIRGGETLDIYATGTARHVPQPASINFGPKGWVAGIQAGPARTVTAVNGRLGSLVGLFDNQHEPLVIGQRRQVIVPRGARSLYLAVLDFPGSASNNVGEYLVTIDVIRR